MMEALGRGNDGARRMIIDSFWGSWWSLPSSFPFLDMMGEASDENGVPQLTVINVMGFNAADGGMQCGFSMKFPKGMSVKA
jgi:hypothetical protein